MDWPLFAQFAAPVISALGGAAVSRWWEQRPRLVSYLGHVSAVPVVLPNGQTLQVNAHSIVVTNVGRKAATNVRVGHNFLPSVGIYPAVSYQVQTVPNGGTEIVFPTLVPGEQLTINYLYFPPISWTNINAYTKSDEGLARILTVLPAPKPSALIRRGGAVLTFIGVATVLYAVAELVITIARRWGGG